MSKKTKGEPGEQTLYKLTTQDNYTRKGEYNQTRWGDNVTHKADGRGGQLCGPGYIHAYLSPALAVFMNEIHAGIYPAKLWEAKGVITLSDMDLKVGCYSLTTVKEMELPKLSMNQHIAFGILVTQQISNDNGWRRWAEKWLEDADRSQDTARIVKDKVSHHRVAEYYTSAAASADGYITIRHMSAAAAAISTAKANNSVFFQIENKKIDLVSLAEEALKYE